MSNENKTTYVGRGAQRYMAFRSKTFNVDNGNGTTDDDVIFSGLPKRAYIVSIRPVYTEATDTTGAAAANWKVGTTAGGAEIVAATALVAAQAVGTAGTAGTLVATSVAAGGALFARHTGVATTEVGEYHLQVLVLLAP